ncbi:MAG: hypothetical protein FK734_14230 [Asgard group archaeon]|nr:hypothetical protein [Asgard group archaeon]
MTGGKQKNPIKIDIEYDESYKKLTVLKKGKITKEKLEKFMKENPGLIIKVSAKEAKDGQSKLEEYMKKDPLGKLILDESEQVFKLIKEKQKEIKQG